MIVEGKNTSTTINIKRSNNALSKFNVGDTIKAQVLSVKGNEVVLNFPNGEDIIATTTVPLEVFIGDNLNLFIKNKSDSQLVLQVLKDTTEQQTMSKIVNTLMELKLYPDERNIEIAKTLLDNNMGLNKSNFLKVINLLSKFTEMDIQTGVFIVANNLNNVKDIGNTFNKFVNNQIEIGKLINNLISQLHENLFPKAIEDIIAKYSEMEVVNKIQTQNKNISTILNNLGNSENEVNSLLNSIIKQSVNCSVKQANLEEIILNNTFTENKLTNLIQNINNKELLNFIENNPKIKAKLIDLLNNKNLVKNVVNEYKEQDSLIFRPRDYLEADSLNKIKQFLDVFININKNGIELNKDVNKLYNQFFNKLNSIEQYIESNKITNSENIVNYTSQIKNCLNFFDNFNNSFYFFQLPVSINDEQKSVDLYIAKNKTKNTAVDPENATLLISLKTKNLGTVESLINVKNKNINFNFKLENKKLQEFFIKNQYILEKLVNDKGYKVNKIDSSVKDESTTLINFEDLIENNTSVDNKAFDIRI